MFFVCLIVLLLLGFLTRQPMQLEALWFILCLFACAGYLAGFLDSRLFARKDKQVENLLHEAESRYESAFGPGESPPA